jgi:hypothetical protein
MTTAPFFLTILLGSRTLCCFRSHQLPSYLAERRFPQVIASLLAQTSVLFAVRRNGREPNTGEGL